MFSKSNFYRTLAVPACLVWAVVEFVALQRARRHHVRSKPLTHSAR